MNELKLFKEDFINESDWLDVCNILNIPYTSSTAVVIFTATTYK